MIIKKLTLSTQNIVKQKKFYCDLLGFKLLSESEKYFEIQTGFSSLRFEQCKDFFPNHFAFGIPFSLYKSALNWLEQRVEILQDEEDKIVDFPAWKAKAIYFYDEDKNICEFIARKDLPQTAATDFDKKQVYNIAEIGLVTQNITKIFEALQQKTGIQKYDGNFRNFLAIGNFQGLIICINKDEKNWFPTNDEAKISDFALDAEIEGMPYQILYKNGKLSFL